MENIIYLHTGSNQGERLLHLASARQMIESTIGRLLLSSGIYATSAWGNEEQPAFLNQALKVKTSLSPFSLLEKIKTIEQLCGRERMIHWGPRTLDIDILFFGDAIIDTKQLIIPHPRLHKRNFVLVPLAEIAGEFNHPVFKQSINSLLENSRDKLEVRKLVLNQE